MQYLYISKTIYSGLKISSNKLRNRDIEDLDFKNLIEEIESLGRCLQQA
ncbi:DUF29 family protein [Trichormus azollae]